MSRTLTEEFESAGANEFSDPQNRLHALLEEAMKRIERRLFFEEFQSEKDVTPTSSEALPLTIDFYETERAFKVVLIRNALRSAKGNQRKAATILGLKPTTLHCMIKRYKIKLGMV